VIVTVATGRGLTVTVVVAVAFPPEPVAVAVYVVVAVGLTDCAPPLAVIVNELPSLPLTATWVAFAAVTVSVDELPVVIDAGLAVMVTVAAGVFVTVIVADADAFPCTPVAVAV
jgi:hypothetical protein